MANYSELIGNAIKAENDRRRANEFNLPAGLAGIASGAFTSGKMFPTDEAGNKGFDLNSLLSIEALYGGAKGALQPVANTPKDLLTGVLSGIEGTTTMNATELGKEKEALTLMSNFDKVPTPADPSNPGEGIFNLHAIAPKTYPTDTWVKRKPAAANMWGDLFASIGLGPNINPGSNKPAKVQEKYLEYNLNVDDNDAIIGKKADGLWYNVKDGSPAK